MTFTAGVPQPGRGNRKARPLMLERRLSRTTSNDDEEECEMAEYRQSEILFMVVTDDDFNVLEST